MRLTEIIISALFLAGSVLSCGANETVVKPPDTTPQKPVKVFTINNTPVALADDSTLKYYPGGKPETGVLSSNTVIDTGALKVKLAEKEIGFYSNQTVRWAYLAEPVKVYGIPFNTNRIEFYPGGKLMNAYPAKGQDVKGYTPVDDYPVFFHETGELKLMIPAGSITVDEIKFQSNTMVSFYSSGMVQRGILAQDTMLYGLTLKGGTPLILYPDGNIWMATLAKPASIKGKKLGAGASVRFNLLGELE
ncbi:MAG: hypothetical protein HPY53_14805 [Brevinematales bacterium]|nr:hypothetical protein [Brevinematales bacterium]